MVSPVAMAAASIPNPAAAGKFIAPIEPIADTTDWIAISNRAELEAMASNLSGKYYLTADINLSGADWAPIGNGSSSP